MLNDIPPRGDTSPHSRASLPTFWLPGVALAIVLLGTPLARADTATNPPSPPITTTNAPANAAVNASWAWLDTLLEPLESLSHWVTGLFSRDERFGENEVARFKHTIDNNLTAFDGLVRQAGFQVASISIGAGAPPAISLTLEFARRLNESEKAVLMAKITDGSGQVDTIQRSIIMTLLSATESVYATRTDGYRLARVEIGVDVSPNITFVLSKGP